MDTEPIFLCVFYDDDDDDDDELFGTSTQRKRGNMLGLSRAIRIRFSSNSVTRSLACYIESKLIVYFCQENR